MPTLSPRRSALFLASALALCGVPLRAQAADSARPQPAVRIGSWADEQLRVDQLLGGAATRGYLLRTASSATPRPGGALRLRAVLPELRTVWNSDIPYSLNENGMYAGRGLSTRVSGGARLDAGPLSVSFVPQLIREQNREFQFIASGTGGRSIYASPWHAGIESADLPLRFGPEGRTRVGLGESSVSLGAGPVRGGAATESQWWGPGVRNALLLSNNAGGFPHLFLRTARPLRTPLGDVEAKWILGRLSESEFFDNVDSNDRRSLNGIGATLRVAFDPGLTVGGARVVYGPAGGAGGAIDVFRRVGHPNVSTEGNTPPVTGVGRDQVMSLFGRWVFPQVGTEVYAEWARTDTPSGLRDLLLEPSRSQAYTFGLQWAKPVRADGWVRVQAETSMLEQSDRNGRHITSFYTSASVLQGYTHRGQVLGAATGPGSSSQHLAADYARGRWRVGALAGRVRWENDALYRVGLQPTMHAHDVSLLAGARGGARVGPLQVGAELISARRLNYLFQNISTSPVNIRTIDLANRTLSLSVGPAPRRPRPAAPAAAVLPAP